MSNLDDVTVRRDQLLRELVAGINKYQGLALANYFFAYALMIATIGASAAAGVGGLFLRGVEKDTVSAIALLPAVFALVATLLKPQARANWHYRKLDRLRALRRRLVYELPAPPSAADIAAVAKTMTELDLSMSKEWEEQLSLNLSAFETQRRPGQALSTGSGPA